MKRTIQISSHIPPKNQKKSNNNVTDSNVPSLTDEFEDDRLIALLRQQIKDANAQCNRLEIDNKYLVSALQLREHELLKNMKATSGMVDNGDGTSLNFRMEQMVSADVANRSVSLPKRILKLLH